MENRKKSNINIARIKELVKSKPAKQSISLINTPGFGRLYALFSVAILLATTLFWSILGARLQSGNADQLVNSYLFERTSTFHDALLPGAHTFLIKWPLFFLVKVLGSSNSAFVFLTVTVVLLTIGVLAALLYRIERRPLIFGSLSLALASTLLLVPAISSPGTLLPVNMAMLATRNFEYVLYAAGLTLLIRSARIKGWEFWLATFTLALLIASDRLFLDLSLGGGLLALLAYALSKGWNLVSLAANWVVASILGAGGAIGSLWFINSRGVTHIAGLSSGSPYGLVHGLHDLLLGILYGVLGIATNFGANPAFDAPIVRDIPHTALSRLGGVSGPAFLVNLAILLVGVFAAWRLIRLSLAHNKDREVSLDRPARLSIMLVWTSLAALLVFIFSSHYYAVDARYLTVCLFALFIALAAYGRGRQSQPMVIVGVGIVISLSIALGSITALRTFNSDQAAIATIAARNTSVSDVLRQHHVKVLVGDYWRVIPIKRSVAKKKVSVMPLSGCFQPRDTLSSKAWQYDLHNNSFAYLLSLDRSLTDYPQCTLKQVIAQYGRPNSSVLIAGSLSKPQELLLFYDRGIHKSAPKITLKTPSTVLPITFDELPYRTCPVPSIMNIVAHEDDDLLFMNPDLIHDINAGHCVRTIYATAGDAGTGQFYWLGRQQGSEAAYSKMLGSDDIWVDRIVRINDHEFITVANPRGNSKISLIFIHLPDGNLKGGGFPSTGRESLAKLDSGAIKITHAIDKQSSYSSDEFVTLLTSLMHAYEPSEIRTQSNYAGRHFTDHSDHMAVGRLVKKAYDKYENQQFENHLIIPLRFYIGYPVHDLPPNVSGADLQDKETAYFEYSKSDPAACDNIYMCTKASTFGSYLQRQYQSDH